MGDKIDNNLIYESEEDKKHRENLYSDIIKNIDKQYYDSQNQLDKYIITISLATIGASLTFLKDNQRFFIEWNIILIISWVFLLLSAIMVVISFKTSSNAFRKQREYVDDLYTGKTMKEEDKEKNKTWTTILNNISFFSFICGIILIIIFFIKNFL
jgi:hypothetical protein